MKSMAMASCSQGGYYGVPAAWGKAESVPVKKAKTGEI
jgi:hypothetical protein